MNFGGPVELVDIIFYFIIQDLIEDAMAAPFCEKDASPKFKLVLGNIFTAHPRLYLRKPMVSKLKLYYYLHYLHQRPQVFLLADSITILVSQIKKQTLRVEFLNKPAESSVTPVDISPIKIEDFPRMLYEFVFHKKNITHLILKADFDLQPQLPDIPDNKFAKGDGDNVWRWNRPVPLRRLH